MVAGIISGLANGSVTRDLWVASTILQSRSFICSHAEIELAAASPRARSIRSWDFAAAQLAVTHRMYNFSDEEKLDDPFYKPETD